MKQILTGVILLVVLLVLPGCSRSKMVSLQFQGTSTMNNGGHFAVVRIFQLTNNTRFLDAAFEEFWMGNGEFLAEESISGTMQQISVYPDQPVSSDLEVSKETRFIGVAANLYDPAGDGWRKIYPVDRLDKDRVVVRITEDQLDVDLP